MPRDGYKPQTLTDVIRWVQGFEEATRETRWLAERDRDYYDNKQWTTEEVAELRRRRQPVLTINRIAPKIDFMLGYERRSRRDPKAYPRTQQHEQAAEAVTDAIRYVCEAGNWDQERSFAFKNFAIEGVCGIDVRVESMDGETIDIMLDHVPWDRLIWDYRSRRPDFSDAKWIGQVAWFDLDDAKEIFGHFKGADEVLDEAVMRQIGSYVDDTYADRPRYTVWTDSQTQRPRVKIVSLYYRKGGKNGPWDTCIFTLPGFIQKPTPSPYLNEKGVPSCPIIIQSAKEDRDNQRYGLVRTLISPQDEINHRRSKALHLLNTRQTVGDRHAIADINKMRYELGKPDGHVTVEPGSRFDILPTNDMIAGQLNLLQEAKQEIDAVGANAALAGRDTNAISGRAIQAKQQGGTLELEPIYDAFGSLQLRVYRSIWDRIKQFWTAEKWIRVTDNEENLRYVGLNRPMTVGEIMQKQGQQLPDMRQYPPQIQHKIQEQLSQVVDTENDVAKIDVDIIISDGADIINIAQEQFQQLSQIPGMPPDILIEASSLRNKSEILERMRSGGASPEQQQAAQQQQQQQQQMAFQNMALEMQQKSADVRKTEAETMEIGTKAARNLHDGAVSEMHKRHEMRSRDTELSRPLPKAQ